MGTYDILQARFSSSIMSWKVYTYSPQSIQVYIVQPFHYRPTNGLEANAAVVGDTLPAFWVGATTPWPKI